MLHRWKSASLRSQLVAIMMALMLVALTATGAGTLTLLHSFLQGQVDDKLRAAVVSAQQQQSFSQLQDQNSNVPTDYSLMLLTPGLAAVHVRRRQGGPPRDHEHLRGRGPGPRADAVPGPRHRRQNWRVVAVTVVDGNRERRRRDRAAAGPRSIR